MKRNYLFLGLLVLVAMVSSCRKIQEDQLLKGLWVVEGLYFDTITTNQMTTFFPNHNPINNCCQYKINFDEDNLAIGYYLTNDSFTYVTAGLWKLTAYNVLQLKLDKFANGEFVIKNKGIKRRHLVSEKNSLNYLPEPPALPYDTTYTRIELVKD